jgi:Flp pilus assembly pilin Flp
MVFVRFFRNFLRRDAAANESGQTMVEYGLVISLIALAAIAGVVLVAGGIDELWSLIGDNVGNAVEDVLS